MGEQNVAPERMASEVVQEGGMHQRRKVGCMLAGRWGRLEVAEGEVETPLVKWSVGV